MGVGLIAAALRNWELCGEFCAIQVSDLLELTVGMLIATKVALAVGSKMQSATAASDHLSYSLREYEQELHSIYFDFGDYRKRRAKDVERRILQRFKRASILADRCETIVRRKDGLQSEALSEAHIRFKQEVTGGVFGSSRDFQESQLSKIDIAYGVLLKRVTEFLLH
ncbi:MAG: hypothetical protein K1X75_17945 [Leptospirales bacterium]|nr:hypothetical protein [Leptospirales bacterium]